uniref:Sprouty RTK signaling antagonist 3 n=1 Tax=Zosterops lateralis melanops TaxID=1220523 RepID=A0A8D2PDG0_ZOSLA
KETLVRGGKSSARTREDTMDPPPAEGFQQVLSIDQIRSIRASNNYVERPAACFQQTRSNPSLSQPPHKQEWPQDRLASSTFQDLHQSQQQHLSHSSTASSVSQSTTASEQRLLGGLTPSHSGHSLVRTQPLGGGAGGGELKAEESPRKGTEQPGAHLVLCEACGLLDYGTCLCCVKGLFYHCSTDDEDTCADEPCSCGPGSCCARWAAMSVLSLLLPCLCCYFPTLGCLKLCQRGYDGLKRPGCRCQSHTNTVCRKISSASGTVFFCLKEEEKVWEALETFWQGKELWEAAQPTRSCPTAARERSPLGFG